MDIIRTGEKIWKEEYAALDLNEDELVMVLSEGPSYSSARSSFGAIWSRCPPYGNHGAAA